MRWLLLLASMVLPAHDLGVMERLEKSLILPRSAKQEVAA